MSCRQLSLEQRLIHKLRIEGYSQARLARLVKVHPSTISRELRRNVSSRGLWRATQLPNLGL